MRFLNGIFEVFKNIFLAIPPFVYRVLKIIVFYLIYLFTYEPGTNGNLTEKKVKRIRAITKFKVKSVNTMPEWLVKRIC